MLALRMGPLLLGLGLLVFWGINRDTPHAGGGLIFLDAMLSVVSFTMAALAPTAVGPRSRPVAPLILSLALFGIWIAGLTSGASPVFCWWNFAFACGYLLVAIAAVFVRGESETSSSREEQVRRSA